MLDELFNRIVNEIREAGGCPPRHRFHNRNADQHMLAVVEAARTMFPGDTRVLAAAQAHDLGKLETYDPADGSYRKHDAASEALYRACADVDEVVARVVGQHSWIYNIEAAGDKAVSKWWRRVSEGLSPEEAAEFVRVYEALTLCDAEGFSPEGRAQRHRDLESFKAKLQVAR